MAAILLADKKEVMRKFAIMQQVSQQSSLYTTTLMICCAKRYAANLEFLL